MYCILIEDDVGGKHGQPDALAEHVGHVEYSIEHRMTIFLSWW